METAGHEVGVGFKTPKSSFTPNSSPNKNLLNFNFRQESSSPTPNTNRTRDLEYGYPSLERGVSFSSSISLGGLGSEDGEVIGCGDNGLGFYEVLRYVCDNGEETVKVKKGVFGEVREVERWIGEDPTKELSTPILNSQGQVVDKRKSRFESGFRLLYGACTYDTKRHLRLLPFPAEIYGLLEKKMGLPEQFLPSMSFRTAAAFRFACSEGEGDSEEEKDGDKFLIFGPDSCHIFKFSIFRPSYYQLAISTSQSQNLTYALLLAKTQDHQFPSLITSLTTYLSPTPKPHSQPNSKPQSKLTRKKTWKPLHLATLLSKHCLNSTDRRVQEADTILNELEETMGQHEWINRPRGDPMEMDFVAVGRRLNFTARMLGVEGMRIGGLMETLKLLKEWDQHLDPKNEGSGNRSREIQDIISYHENCCRNLKLRVEYEKGRVQSQLGVVYQFTTQASSKVQLSLASTSASIARDTKKDGQAMKTIAILTMFFLPGTFLAAVFAMPLFNWEDDGKGVLKGRFWVYWAFAIPLTVVVLLVWALLMFVDWEGVWRGLTDGLVRRGKRKRRGEEEGKEA